MKPLPTQLSGALHLASQRTALLADEPRVGKTGAAVIAADYEFAETILVITTASGRAVWRRGIPFWSAYPRQVQVLAGGKTLDPRVPCAVIGWGGLANNSMRAALLKRRWDLVIPDEEHYAKNFETKRTQALYGLLVDDGLSLDQAAAIVSKADRVWPLTGSPFPNSLLDGYPRLRALAPERLRANPARGWPDVTTLSAYKSRYCIIGYKKIGHGCYARRQEVVVGGKNEEELRERMRGFILLRTQADVGIQPPRYETWPLYIDDKTRRTVNGDKDRTAILKAIDEDSTDKLKMHLGEMRRHTGEIKARLVVEAVKEEFAGGLDKVVLMRWHEEVGAIIREGLAEFGVVTVDGKTSPTERAAAEEAFKDPNGPRVFDGQIQAAGEAIDLSAAALLIFVEPSLIPKDMKQASLRITNHTQTRQALVRVAVLENSIDEDMQEALLRKWVPIRKVLS